MLQSECSAFAPFVVVEQSGNDAPTQLYSVPSRESQIMSSTCSFLVKRRAIELEDDTIEDGLDSILRKSACLSLAKLVLDPLSEREGRVVLFVILHCTRLIVLYSPGDTQLVSMTCMWTK
jgi:hypothetical protein